MNKELTKDNRLFTAAALILGLVIAFIYLGPELAKPFSVQDDFRQSFFWVWSYWDNSLFQNDFFAEMYHSHITRLPILNTIFYFAANLNLDLILFSKQLALIVGALSTLAAYLFMHSFTKNKVIALAFSIFMSFIFYCTDHISASQARSFVWLGLFTYLYLKNINKDLWAALFTFVLLFLSPNTFLLCLGMEGFFWLYKSIEVKKLKLATTNFLSVIFNAVSAFVVYKVIFKDIQTQGVGRPFTVPEMKILPEFNPGGRHPIFGSHLGDGTWWHNEHWGIGVGYLPISIVFGIACFAVVAFFILKLALKQELKLDRTLVSFICSSVTLFFMAQLLFPMLYLPSRYLGVPCIILSSIVIFLAIARLCEFLQSYLADVVKVEADKLLLGSQILISLVFVGFFFLNSAKYIHLRYVEMNPAVQKILVNTPKNSLIAGYPTLPDINAASILTKRKIYVDYERSMAYTHESLNEIRHRNKTVLEMVFATNKEDFLRLAKQEGITHFLALLDLYHPKNLSNLGYIEPYNAYIRDLLKESKGKFYLSELLQSRKERYSLIQISEL